ncbi:MAG TPA: hypothetical protein VJV96_12840 [Candidatus Angelobacter sp.]|jgi:hypothetical protein|nr:hypothetical protein [Candidatus Angelobacter sp.]
MRDLSNQVDRLTGELRALRLQLQWSTFRRSSHKDQDDILNNLLNAGLVEHLRTVVDQFSHFLWCYIESAATNADTNIDFGLQSKRLDQVTEMLRLLRHSSCPSNEQLEFVARVTRTVDRHLQEVEGKSDARLGQTA